jgi:hypothetical protein
MYSPQPVWCHKCNLRIAPYDLRTVFRSHDYHRNCFLRMVQHETQETRSQVRPRVVSEKRK